MAQLEFPSTEHHESLRQRLKTGNFQWTVFTEPERWAWHAYDYGWRGVYLPDGGGPASPIDPQRLWFHPLMVEAVEDMRLAQLKRRRPAKRREPTADDLAHVRRCVEIALDNVKKFAARSRAAFNPTPGGRMAAETAIAAMGHSAKPAPWYEDPGALRRGRDELGLL